MQRDERQLDASLDALIHRVTEIKNSLAGLIMKLEVEYETLSWPSVLDNFALLSGQITTLNRLIKHEKTPQFHNQICLPILLSPDRNIALEKLTEGRVFAFNHEVVPDYLRTKPDSEAEEKMNQLSARASQTTPDNIQKQIAALNKVVNNAIEMITTQREDWESDMKEKYVSQPTCNIEDTSTLVAATSLGKGLKRRQDMTGNQQPQRPPSAGANSQQAAQAQQAAAQQAMQAGKVASAIKTNIRAGNRNDPYKGP